jgi:SPP1 gp7 family putative phage head morphogenesis protein
MTAEKPPILPPREAIGYFRRKGLEFGFDWQDVWQEEHAKAFTVAKAMTRDLLEDIREAVDQAISEGRTLAMFREQLTPILVAKGWWGRKSVTDPASGETVEAQLGSPRRLKTIYQTNMRTSYQAGRFERIQRQKKAFPFLRYMSVKDGRERFEHGEWHGTILPVDDPWWDTHYPPCGWNCRCTPQPINQRMMDRRGWQVTDEPKKFPLKKHVNKRTGEITEIERGVDPGWSYHVGKANLDGLTPPPINGASGDEDAIASTFSEADKRSLRPFFENFGLTTKNQMISGRVYEDADGWPLAISSGLFRGIVVLPGPGELKAVANAITEPVQIRLRWVRGKDGGLMLMRRYIGSEAVVDIGRTGWRWLLSSRTDYQKGALVFQS